MLINLKKRNNIKFTIKTRSFEACFQLKMIGYVYLQYI